MRIWNTPLLFPAALVVLASCGGGASVEQDTEGVRAAVTAVLTAAARDDLRAALPSLAVSEFAGASSQVTPKPWAQLSKAEQDAVANAMWALIRSVPRDSLLRDPAAIGASLASGKTEVRRRLRQATITFTGPGVPIPPSGKVYGNRAGDPNPKPVSYAASLSLGNDGLWRVTKIEPVFGR